MPKAPDNVETPPSIFEIHLRRQAKLIYPLLQKLLNEKPENAEDIATSLDGFSWRYECQAFGQKVMPQNTDPQRKDKVGELTEPAVEHNFYPPFLNRQLLATYHPFFAHVPVPPSCKANRGGTKTEEIFYAKSYLPQIPDLSPETIIDESLGKEAGPIHDLESDNGKLPMLKDDSPRVRFIKQQIEDFNSFCYPSLLLPPNLSLALQESLLTGPPKTPIQTDNVLASDSIDVVKEAFEDGEISDKDLESLKVRLSLCMLVDVSLRALEIFITDPRIVRGIQEALHYTFNHGFVRLVTKMTGTDLSSYATYGGLTHHTKTSHGGAHRALPKDLQREFLLDQIYAYLILTWQTFLTLWHQSLDAEIIKLLKERLSKERRLIYDASSVRKMSDEILKIVLPKIVIEAAAENLPNLCTQSQLQNFRVFITERSGIPHVIPLLLQDVVPIDMAQSPLYLWSHTYLLNFAAFILNQGDYQRDTLSQSGNSLTNCVLCHCNLCSPFKTPVQNKMLKQELELVGNLNIDAPATDGSGKNVPHLRLTPQLFVESFLRPALNERFLFDRVIFYAEEPEFFPQPDEGFVIKDSVLLDRLSRTRRAQEVKLLCRGGGRYLDPETGDDLTLRSCASKDIVLDALEGIGESDDSALKRKHAGALTNDRTSPILSASRESTSSGETLNHAAPADAGQRNASSQGGGRRGGRRGGGRRGGVLYRGGRNRGGGTVDSGSGADSPSERQCHDDDIIEQEKEESGKTAEKGSLCRYRKTSYREKTHVRNFYMFHFEI